MKAIQAHFKSAPDRQAALAKLDTKDRPKAKNPEGLHSLVKEGKVAEKHVKYVHIKLGGMSRARKPKSDKPKQTFAFRLGAPFIASTDGPSTVAQIAQSHPGGFRSPSKKAKNWRSTSLVEQVMKQKQKFEYSARGKKKLQREEECQALALATQDIRNIPDQYLNRGSRVRKQLMLPLPKAATVAAIRERFAELANAA